MLIKRHIFSISIARQLYIDSFLEILSDFTASDISRWQHAIADRYIKTLDKFVIHELTDDPKKVSLRRLYTRTDITDTTGWPPSETDRVYEDYSKLFIEVHRSICS